MNFKLTLTLVIVLLLLASLFLMLRNHQPAVKPPENAAASLFESKLTGLKAFSYSRDGKEQAAFVKTGDKWNLTFPVQAPADPSVGWTADDLKALAYKEKFEPAAAGVRSAESTGTQNPRNLIKLTDDEGKEYTIALGKRSIGGIFATLNGGKTIYLLATNPLDQLDKDPQEFRNKNIKDIATDKITTLTIKRPHQTIVLTKAPGVENNWLITAPISTRANASVINEMLDQLKSINATGFSDMTRDMPGTSLNPPILSVTALVNESPSSPTTAPATTSKPSETPVTLNLGCYTDLTNKKNVYAALDDSSSVFTLGADAFTKLNRELNDLRDPAVTPAAVGEATEFTITSLDKPVIKVTKKDGKWSFLFGPLTTPPNPIPGDNLAIGDLLGDIRNLRAIHFDDNVGNLVSIGLQPPQTTIDLAVPHQSQHEVLLIGKPETDVAGGKVTPMMRQGEPTVYLVPSADVEKIIPTPLSLRDKSVERLASESIRGITISGPAAGPSAAVLEHEGTSWIVKAAGKSQKADDEKITDLLADFTPLTAAKYLAENTQVSGNPDLTVSLTVLETPAATAATSPATAPVIGPQIGKTLTHTLKLYKSVKDNQTTWKAIWDGPAPQWTFEPTPDLVTHVTNTTYPAPTTQPATQSSTQPAPAK